MTKRNFSKPFSIGGCVVGVIYCFAIVFGRAPSGEIVPFSYLVQKFLVLSLFCGVFGALIGLGLGLLVSAFWPNKR
ncbi:MAG TPA: hypothetical protein VFG14_02990 [Chthoniobacteraceae bacterium]|nr:hypothetical protein [Chthoniobacteraceae bacterium]